MSDYKRYVLRSTYNETVAKDNRLKIEKTRIDYAAKQAEAKLKQAETDVETEASKVQGNVDKRVSEAKAMLNDEINTLYENIGGEIGRNNAKFREEIDGVRAEIGKVNLRTEELRGKVNTLAEEFNSRIRKFTDKIKDKERRARAYVEQLNSLVVRIGGLNPNKLAPDDYEELEKRLQYARADLENGDHGACVGTCQIAITSATRLLAELTLLNEEFRLISEELDSRIKEVTERLNEVKNPKKNERLLQTEGMKLKFDGNVSFWSDGVLGELAENFEKVVEGSAKNREMMDIEAMKEDLGAIQLLPSYIDRCISLAEKEYMVSYSMEKLIGRIDVAMVSDGRWGRVSSGYASEDRRRSYTMIYESGLLTAAFVVMPTREVKQRKRDGSEVLDPIKFKLNVYCESDEYLADLTKNAIIAMLEEEYGIDVEGNKTSTTNNKKTDNYLKETVALSDGIKTRRIDETRNLLRL